MKRSVNIILILLLTSSYLQVYSQKKNDKKYRGGYIIRFSDTINCRIYTGSQANEIGHEMTFKYNDGRIITYNAGSAIKGFGYKTDSIMIHYFQIEVPKYWIQGETNTKAYAEVVIDGQVRLYRYTKIKNSVAVVPSIIVQGVNVIPIQKRDRTYFIKVNGEDSLYEVGGKNILGGEYVEREEIAPFLKGQPQIIANVPAGEYIYMNKLKAYLTRYNEWFRTKKQQE